MKNKTNLVTITILLLSLLAIACWEIRPSKASEDVTIDSSSSADFGSDNTFDAGTSNTLNIGTTSTTNTNTETTELGNDNTYTVTGDNTTSIDNSADNTTTTNTTTSSTVNEFLRKSYNVSLGGYYGHGYYAPAINGNQTEIIRLLKKMERKIDNLSERIDRIERKLNMSPASQSADTGQIRRKAPPRIHRVD